MKKIKPFIHPATPPKLKTEFRRARYKFHVLAQARGINVKFIHDLIHYGKEPTDRTENGRNIRVKLFLPRKRRLRQGEPEPRPYSEPPEEIKWWRSLKKDARRSYIQNIYQLEGGNHANQDP